MLIFTLPSIPTPPLRCRRHKRACPVVYYYATSPYGRQMAELIADELREIYPRPSQGAGAADHNPCVSCAGQMPPLHWLRLRIMIIRRMPRGSGGNIDEIGKSVEQPRSLPISVCGKEIENFNVKKKAIHLSTEVYGFILHKNGTRKCDFFRQKLSIRNFLKKIKGNSNNGRI